MTSNLVHMIYLTFGSGKTVSLMPRRLTHSDTNQAFKKVSYHG